jgi:acyl-CoA thioester hydrolase
MEKPMNQESECAIWDKDRVCLVPIALLEELTVYHRETIPSAYLDVMGHMNIRWYMALYDMAARQFFMSHGLDEDFIHANQAGTFALKHMINYYAEVRVGQTAAVRTRLLGRSDRRFHAMQFMINETTGRLASTLEMLGTYADLQKRRAAAIPPEIAAKFDAKLAADRQLDWEAPVSGVIGLD